MLFYWECVSFSKLIQRHCWDGHDVRSVIGVEGSTLDFTDLLVAVSLLVIYRISLS